MIHQRINDCAHWRNVGLIGIFQCNTVSDSQALEWLYTMNGVNFLFLTQVLYLCTQFELI